MFRKSIGKSAPHFRPRMLALVGALCLAPVWAMGGNPPPAGKGHEDPRPAHAARKPVDVVKDFYDKLGKGDLPGMLGNFAKDAKWVLHGPSGIPFAGVHEGVDGIRGFIETFGKNAKVSVFETREYVSDKDQVVVLGYEEATAAPTGKAWKAHWTHVFTVERGRITFVDEVLDTAPVLAAFTP